MDSPRRSEPPHAIDPFTPMTTVHGGAKKEKPLLLRPVSSFSSDDGTPDLLGPLPLTTASSAMVPSCSDDFSRRRIPDLRPWLLRRISAIPATFGVDPAAAIASFATGGSRLVVVCLNSFQLIISETFFQAY